MKILLLEDDASLAETICDTLSSAYVVEIVSTGQAAIVRGQSRHYDLMIFDVILPDIDGVTVCQQIRAAKIKTPILMLTARDSVEQKVEALDAGADDYVTKPFSLAELTARVRALLRRQHNELVENPIKVKDLLIDTTCFSVERCGKPIQLRRKEFSLLAYLARHAGQTVTRQMILDHVWGADVDLLSNTVDVHINSLRAKVDRPFRSRMITTVPGIGYKLAV